MEIIEFELGELVNIKHGFGFKGEYFSDEKKESVLVTPGNFSIGGGFKDDKLKYYDGPIPKGFVLSTGDVVVTMTDLSKEADTLGYSAKVPQSNKYTYLHNQRIGLIELLNNSIDLQYLYWLMRTENYQKFVAGSASGATVKHTSPNRICAYRFKAPKNKLNQQKIASILNSYDDLIENNLKRINLLEEMAQITYEEWFVRMKFPGHESAVFDEETGLPEGWEKIKIGDEIFVGRGSSPRPISDQVYFDKGDIPWLKIADATASHIYVHKTKLYVNEYGASYSRKRPAGSIVVAASGTLGFPMFLATEACVHDGWLYFDKIPENMTEYFYFTFFYLKEYFERVAYGAAIQNINTGIVKGAPLIMPNNELLQLFSEKSGKIMDTILNLQKQNILLKEARDILLPRLMTGMIDLEQVELPEAMLKRLEQQEDEMTIA
jgi:type I restriction enzyme S subunit